MKTQQCCSLGSVVLWLLALHTLEAFHSSSPTSQWFKSSSWPRRASSENSPAAVLLFGSAMGSVVTSNEEIKESIPCPARVNMSIPSPALKEVLTVAQNPLAVEDLLSFERDGFIVQRGLFAGREVESEIRPVITAALEARINEMWQHSTRVMLGDENTFDDFGESMYENVEGFMDALEDVELPFLQAFNCWRHFPVVEQICRTPRLAATAAQLLGVERVRLYQDSMFLKRPGDGPTRWHSDLHMAPFDTNHMVTAWIPLDHVPAQEHGGTGLTFARGSHRDFALPFWSRPQENGADLQPRYENAMVSAGSLSPGDITWHHGWTLHSAPPMLDADELAELAEESDSHSKEGGFVAPGEVKSRLAFTVSFIADGARVLGPMSPVDKETRNDDCENLDHHNHYDNCIKRDDASALRASHSLDHTETSLEKLSPLSEKIDWSSENFEFIDEDDDDDEEEEGEEDEAGDVAPPLWRRHEPDAEDCTSYEDWLPDIEAGAVADHPLLPVVWPPSPAASR